MRLYIYISDPDGNGIEIYIDRKLSEWTWNNNEVEMTVDPLDFENLLSETTEAAWTYLPAETVIGHIHLHVSELKQTETFYIKGLGFDIVNRFGSEALFISTGDYHHHIALINTWAGIGAPTPPLNSTGLKSFTLILANETARNNVIKQLKKFGAIVTQEKGTL